MIRSRLRWGWATLGLAWLAFPFGCLGPGGDELPREPVWGKVTLDGKPLKRGAITFSPDGAGAAPAGGMISEGEYSIPRDGGPTPGKYRVAILGDEEGDASPSDEPPGPPPKASRSAPKKPPMVPDKYNAKTTLTAEVKAGESNAIDFDLKSQ